MNKATYITYAQMEEYANRQYEQLGTKLSFKTIARYLFDHGYDKEGNPALPREITWSSINDSDFYTLLDRLPVKNIFFSASAETENIIEAESIMPQELEVYALKYIQYIVEKMHMHNCDLLPQYFIFRKRRS